ncbi:acetoacetate metabolism regulatory protein AtoC [Compostibacillus humi]|uniref:Acetoacetate metabolism regulatory protein AtoC n=1 Tax=Compostibacillus humi TaxID=1245525 RepID=A0A8J2TQB2_9BACI|nr:sigma-54 dependent transcriptional regulator [Compostibacillus humi]GFZ89097.1 acetoacetate metabolism regulatory protein AtoC [Compostibacillus humi]
MKNILLVDDETKILKILKSSLSKKGYTVFTAANGQEARRKISEVPANLVFLDVKLPDVSGLQLLQEFIGLYPNKVYIMMTAYGNIDNAVSAMKVGAFDYMTKPVRLDELVLTIEKAFEWIGVKEENKLLKEQLQQTEEYGELIASSNAMKNILQLVERVAPTEANVLIQGESGTGKTKIAHMIHKLSERKNGPFIPVNCASIPEQLLESELFGYEKGAFTGAVASRKGKFESSDGGTIFLDEIGEISQSFQAKLLQITQDKTFMRVGSNVLRKADTRIICATNQDLKKLVEAGQFREDLYYRLNIVDIYIPSLRERKEEVPVLVEKFLERYRKKYERNFQVNKELLNQLMQYNWPGNVRELENAIERAVVLCRGELLTIEDFPKEIRDFVNDDQIVAVEETDNMTLPEVLSSIEKKYILKALDESLGQPSKAAKKLGISRQSLLYKMKKYFS